MARSDRRLPTFTLPTLALGVVLIVGGCAGAAPTIAPPEAGGSQPPALTETPNPPAVAPGGPDAPVDGGAGQSGGGFPGGTGGGVTGDPGSGVVPGDPGSGGGTGFDPGPVLPPPEEQATIVSPVAGLMDVHDVGAVALSATVDLTQVTVRLSWWSGVAPCSVLSRVDVARDGSTFTLTVREGSAARDVACIDIAMYKATLVSLGNLEPGRYTVRAAGDAAPIEVVVEG